MDKQIKGHTYRIGKMAARTQFHVLRRVAPLLASAEKLPAIMALSKQAKMEEQDAAALFNAVMGPLTQALASMKDEDLDYVMDSCFGACARLTADGKPQPLLAMNGGMMFADMEMPEMVELVIATMLENYGNFFDLIPGASG